jgi:hypothetical protein
MSFDILIDREYYPCGCAYLIDPQTGEDSLGVMCEKHRDMQTMELTPI